MADQDFLNGLANKLGNIIHNVAKGSLQEKYSGPIPAGRAWKTGSEGKLAPVNFAQDVVAGQNYLEIVINHMYLKEDRRLWMSQEHLGAVWMSFNYNGATQTVPFVIGRELLADKVKNLPEGARLEFQNVHVGKPFPYNGDVVALYLGLWSTPTVDWSSTLFGAINLIANKVQVAPSLSTVLDMVDVLNQGISMVLGLKQVQAVLNLYQEFQDPASGDIAALKPGYYVMVNAPRAGFNASQLVVMNDRLYRWDGTQEHSAEPFYDTDFVLYSISALDKAPGAEAMFRKQYREVLRSLIGSKADPARMSQAVQAYHTLQTQIVTSPDLTVLDQNRLIDFYKNSLTADAVRLTVNISNVAFAAGGPTELPVEIPIAGAKEYESYLASEDLAKLHGDPAISAVTADEEFRSILEQVKTS